MSRKQNIKEVTDRNTGEILPQPRGFRMQMSGTLNRAVYVRLGYRAEKCTGEAHSNPHIDNCMICLSGLWGIAAVKVRPTRAQITVACDGCELAARGYCPRCGRDDGTR